MGTSSLDTRNRQLQYLQAMGIQAWDLRNSAVELSAVEQAVVDLLRFGGLVSEISLLEGINRVVPGFAVLFEQV